MNFIKFGVIGTSIRLEVSSLCQLNCPPCSNKEIRNKGYLKFIDFKKFLATVPTIRSIELSNYGEIFLNPELGDIIKYAHEKNINLTADNGVNLNSVSEEMLESLVKYKFRSLLVSIDGASNNTYKIYRIGGDFNKVIENIKRINSYKKLYNSEYPRLTWKFILFDHNQDEVDLAKKMAKALHMNFWVSLNWDSHAFPLKGTALIRKHAPFLSREEHEKKTKKPYMSPCRYLWMSPQINWDGTLLGCCANKENSFGNVFKEGFKECLKSKKYKTAKRTVLFQLKADKNLPCFGCSHHRKFMLGRFYMVRELFYNICKRLKEDSLSRLTQYH